MKKVTDIKSKVVPLPIKDVDTDQILPAQFLTSISRDGFGANVFRRLRDTDPNFPMNLPQYQGAEILCAESNFGCGSSREHAVWALQGGGFRAVIAPSFADIFFSNSGKNGLVLVQLPQAAIDQILEGAKSGTYEVKVSLADEEVTLNDGTKFKFKYDPFRRHCLLTGQEDLDYIMSHQGAIDSFRAKQAAHSFINTKGS